MMKTKHSHRTPGPEKPLVEMNEEELDGTFDTASLELHALMLQEAREDKDQDTVYAVTILTTPDGKTHIAHSEMEYGDGEGIRSVNDFSASINRSALLLPGESLACEVREVTAWRKRMLQ